MKRLFAERAGSLFFAEFCFHFKFLNKQYKTVDNSLILLYTVCIRRDAVECHNQ